jgi:hypothetical protein
MEMNKAWKLIAAYYDCNRWIRATYESPWGDWDTILYPPEESTPDEVILMADEDERMMAGVEDSFAGQSGLARTNTEKIMVITPAMTDATWALLMAMMDDAGSGEKFRQLPPMEQAHIITSQIVRNRLMDIVRDALQFEAEYLTRQ